MFASSSLFVSQTAEKPNALHPGPLEQLANKPGLLKILLNRWWDPDLEAIQQEGAP
jgi:hypothetical protein